MLKNNKAQAQIITTILLILLVLVSIVIVWSVVVNLVSNDKISRQTSCFYAIDVLSVDKGKTCYEHVNILGNMVKEISLTAKRNMKQADMTGFTFIITTDTGSEVFEVINGTTSTTELNMDELIPPPTLQIPSQGESKSYKVKTTIPQADNIKYIEIAPILSNKKCTPIEKVKINSCS